MQRPLLWDPFIWICQGIDVEAEKVRLSKELERLNQLVSVGEKKLENPKFVNSAPEKVVEGAKKQLEATRIKRDDTLRILNSLS